MADDKIKLHRNTVKIIGGKGREKKCRESWVSLHN